MKPPREVSPEEPSSFEIESEELDPRVQDELEKLNNCTDEINRLEVQLDDANTVFRSLLSTSTHHLKALSKRLGSCIEKARPYYESLDAMTKAQAECQKAAVQFQRAAGIHAAAKETISLAEERFQDNSGEWQFDNAWQEMLNHATIKVMDAEKQRTASEKEHLARSAVFTEVESKVKSLEKKLSRHIDKSKTYFEQKDVFNKALNSEKARVQSLQLKISQTKSQYAQSLRNLEEISESIHERRKITQSRLECPDFDSLQYDLEACHLDDTRSLAAASDLTETTSDCMSGRDSALGSSSLAGESLANLDTVCSPLCVESLANLDTGEGKQGFSLEKTGVSRSFSLPDQMANFGGEDCPVTSSSRPPSHQPEQGEAPEVTSMTKEETSIRL